MADLRKVLRVVPAAAAALRRQDQIIIEVNDDFTGLLGYGRGDLVGRTSSELGLYPDPDDEAAFAQMIRDAESLRGCEIRIRTKSGEMRDALLSSQAIELFGGPHQIVAFFDITERKRIEVALRGSEERYRALTQSANDAIVSADQRGNITSWNSGAETIFGYTDNEIIGRPLTVLMPKRLHQPHMDGLRRFVETGESQVIGRTVELSGTRKDDSEFPLEVSLATWKTADGRFFTGILP